MEKLTCSNILGSQEGFSLLGALIGMAIFVIGILAVFTMQTHSMVSAGRSTKLTQSAAWAQDVIETLITSQYDDPAFEPPSYSGGGTIDPLEQVNCKDNSMPNGLIHELQEGPYTLRWVIFTSDNNGQNINNFSDIRDNEMFDHVDKTQVLQDIPENAKLISIYVSHPSGEYSQYAFVKSNI